jgi:alpha-L-fucosidase 2
MGRNIGTILAHAVVTASLLATTDAKELWSSQPAVSSDIMRTAYPLGNGRLGVRRILLHLLFIRL